VDLPCCSWNLYRCIRLFCCGQKRPSPVCAPGSASLRSQRCILQPPEQPHLGWAVACVRAWATRFHVGLGGDSGKPGRLAVWKGAVVVARRPTTVPRYAFGTPMPAGFFFRTSERASERVNYRTTDLGHLQDARGTFRLPSRYFLVKQERDADFWRRRLTAPWLPHPPAAVPPHAGYVPLTRMCSQVRPPHSGTPSQPKVV